MGVKRKLANKFTTIRISKKAETMLRRYAVKIPKKSSKGIKYETNETIFNRIMLDPRVGYHRFQKPIHKYPKPTIERFVKITKDER